MNDEFMKMFMQMMQKQGGGPESYQNNSVSGEVFSPKLNDYSESPDMGPQGEKPEFGANILQGAHGALGGGGAAAGAAGGGFKGAMQGMSGMNTDMMSKLFGGGAGAEGLSSTLAVVGGVAKGASMLSDLAIGFTGENEGAARAENTHKSSFLGDIPLSFNEVGTESMGNFDFNVTESGYQGRADLKKQNKVDNTMEALGGIPILGDTINTVSNAGKMLTKGKKTGKKHWLESKKGFKNRTEDEAESKADIQRQYENVAREETIGAQQSKLASLFAEGGYMDIFADGGENHDDTGDIREDNAGIQMIEAGESHENDEMGGIHIGGNNIAEKGEVRAELGGREFIFTNRF
tara:strand:- start:38884 stop:39930 length:1047 start_codon:yes stop_codon:yes gene_type:complete